jgi:hypothetical protein
MCHHCCCKDQGLLYQLSLQRWSRGTEIGVYHNFGGTSTSTTGLVPFRVDFEPYKRTWILSPSCPCCPSLIETFCPCRAIPSPTSRIRRPWCFLKILTSCCLSKFLVGCPRQTWNPLCRTLAAPRNLINFGKWFGFTRMNGTSCSCLLLAVLGEFHMKTGERQKCLHLLRILYLVHLLNFTTKWNYIN